MVANVSPLVGYNDNIEHRGQTYHVQTEDSGPRRPHVITHLFADGGRIVTSTKTSYKDHVGEGNADDKVRSLMRAQHKAMLSALRGGEFDELLEGSAQPMAPKGAPPPPAMAASPVASEDLPGATGFEGASLADAGQLAEFAPSGAVVADDGTPPAGSAAAVPAPPKWLTEGQPTAAAETGDAAPVRTADALRSAAKEPASAGPLPPLDFAEDEANQTRPGRRQPATDPEVVPPVGSAVPVDVLERAAAAAEREFYREIQPDKQGKVGGNRPRKPTPLHGAGTYRYVASEGDAPKGALASDAAPESIAPPRKRRYPQTSPGRRKARGSRSGAGRPDGARSSQDGAGLQFGERFLTNRSLDEVILDFLSKHLRT